jgi:homocysteine S-methyltransferase
LVELLEEEKVQVPSWICFSSVDGKSLCSGESFADCLKILNASEKVAVVGVNCTPPQFIEGIICEFRKVCKHLYAQQFLSDISCHFFSCLDMMTCYVCFYLIHSPFCLHQQTKKAIAVYPNSGEVWDGRAKRWLVSRHHNLRSCGTKTGN